MEEIKNKGNDKTAKEEGTYVVLQIVIEMLARGIEFLPVDIYKSDWRVYIYHCSTPIVFIASS